MATAPPTLKLTMAYPCSWIFKVIGSDQAALRGAAAEVFGDNPCTISSSNSSRTGKYHCLDLEVTVTDETTRNTFHHKLKNHPAVKLVL
jgi:putative lipoic acid-binding regulatory protein